MKYKLYKGACQYSINQHLPIAITFLLGVFIFAFNNYLFDREAGNENGENLSTTEMEKKDDNKSQILPPPQ